MRRRMLTVRLRAHVCGTSRRVTESSFNSLSLYLYTTTYRHTGAGPCYLAVRPSVLVSSYGRVTWASRGQSGSSLFIML